MELMFPFLINVTITLFVAKFTFVYHTLQYISAKSGLQSSKRLLPTFGKIFERVIYNSLFNYFQSNKLFMPYQSGFLPGDSSIAQILSTKPEIQITTLQLMCERGVFLDISKAFEKVCHDSLIFKLKSYSVEGELLSHLKKLSPKL